MSEVFLSDWLSLMWSAIWQSSVLLAAIWLVCRAFPKLPAKIKAILWWLVAAKLFISLIFVSGIPLRVLPAEESPFAFLNHRLDLLAPEVKAPAARSTYLQIIEGTSSILPSPPEPQQASLVGPALFSIWALGVIVFLAIFCAQWLVAKKLWMRSVPIESELGGLARQLGIQFGLSHTPKLRESFEITAPMVVGTFRPAVLLPSNCVESLSSQEMEMSLAHELAHIRRSDLPLGLVPMLAQAFFFFLPTVWLARRNWETEREAACDALALDVTRSSPSDYGRMLMKIVTQDSQGGYAAALGATANYHSLKERLLRMNIYSPKSSRVRIASICLVAAAMLFVLPWQITAQSGADGKNEVVNGGFEDGTSRWTQGSLPPNANTPVAISVDSQTAKSGKNSLKFAKTAKGFFPVALMAQQIPYDGKKKRLKVGVWVKAQSAFKFTLAVIMNGDEGKIEWGAYVGDTKSSSVETNHDWKYYTSVVAVPEDTGEITLALQIYGPGTVWVDDVSATYVADNTPVVTAVQDTSEDPEADIKDVPNEDRKVAGDPRMRYFLIGKGKTEPADGYKVLVVLPGGDGSAAFNPFLRRIWKGAMPEGYLICELVAPKWSDDQFETIVWPTNKKRWATMKFSTEQFIDAVLTDVKKSAKVNPKHVYTLSWSSGGPAAYAASLSSRSIKGSFVAMSIYRPEEMPPASGAKGQAYYLLHSPTDFIKMEHPKKAQEELSRGGAKVTLETYEGGHGWHGDVFGMIRKGVEWLEKNSAQ